jgi:hypothetical protein
MRPDEKKFGGHFLPLTTPGDTRAHVNYITISRIRQVSGFLNGNAQPF